MRRWMWFPLLPIACIVAPVEPDTDSTIETDAPAIDSDVAPPDTDLEDTSVEDTDVEDTAVPPVDGDGDGYDDTLDCDDADDTIHPDAVEACNELDDDCDGAIDDGAVFLYVDADGDGLGDPREQTCGAGVGNSLDGDPTSPAPASVYGCLALTGVVDTGTTWRYDDVRDENGAAVPGGGDASVVRVTEVADGVEIVVEQGGWSGHTDDFYVGHGGVHHRQVILRCIGADVLLVGIDMEVHVYCDEEDWWLGRCGPGTRYYRWEGTGFTPAISLAQVGVQRVSARRTKLSNCWSDIYLVSCAFLYPGPDDAWNEVTEFDVTVLPYVEAAGPAAGLAGVSASGPPFVDEVFLHGVGLRAFTADFTELYGPGPTTWGITAHSP